MHLPPRVPRCFLSWLLTADGAPFGLYAQSAVAVARSSVTLAKPESVGLSSEGLARMDEGMQGLIDKQHLAGIVTLLARHGKVVQHKAYGMQDPAEQDADAARHDRAHLLDDQPTLLATTIEAAPGEVQTVKL